MLVLGMLEKAQFELTGDPSLETFTPLARVIADKTNASDVRPYFWNGTDWKEFQFVEPSTSGYYSLNSGTAVTIDWTNGLTQILTLTGNCVISFSNPVPDQEHTLIIRQASGSNPSGYFNYIFNMPEQEPNLFRFQERLRMSSNITKTYSWLYKPSLIDPYVATFVNTAQPFTATSGNIGIDISPDRQTVLLGNATTPFLSMFEARKLDRSQRISFFGNRNTTAPGAASGSIKDICYHPNVPVVFMASAITPFIQCFAIDNTNRPISLLGGNPDTLPAGAAQCCDLSPRGDFLAVGHATTPFISLYQLNLGQSTAANWATKSGNPLSLPAAQVNAIRYSPFSDYLAIGSQTTPFLEVYQMNASGDAIVAKVENPSPLPAGGPAPDKGGSGVAWRPQGDFIAMSMSVTPYVYIVPFNRTAGTFGTPLTFTDTVNASTGGNTGVAWSPCGRWLYTCGTGGAFSTFFCIYDFQSLTIGAALRAISSLATSTSASGIRVDPDGSCVYLALTGTNAVMNISVDQAAKDYLRIR